MNRINDGGPAVPGQWYDFQPLTGAKVVREQWCCMALRDYFAAKAMQSLISKHGFISDEINFAAEHSYEIADAMLKARENTNDRRDAAPAVQGEPVAYISQEDFEFLLSDDMSNQYGTRQVPVFSRKGCRASVPLYASPQPPAQIAEGRSDE